MLNTQEHLQGGVEDGGTKDCGAAAGLSVSEYLVLPSEARVAVTFSFVLGEADEDYPPEGFLELRKL